MKIAWAITVPLNFGNGIRWSNKDKYEFSELFEKFEKSGYSLSIMEKHLNDYSDFDMLIIHNLDKDGYKRYLDSISKNPDLKLFIIPLSYCSDYLAPNNTEKRLFDKNIYAGFSQWIHNNKTLMKRSHRAIKNRFTMPVPKYSLALAQTREDFCAKYSLDPRKKIIVFFSGRFDDTWFNNNPRRQIYYDAYETTRQIFTHYHQLKESFFSQGYQLVIKLHRRFNYHYFQKSKDHRDFDFSIYQDITDTEINDLDYCGLLKHADAALIGNMGTTQLMLYMYGIKSIFVDTEEPEENSWIKFMDNWDVLQFTMDEFKEQKHKDYSYGIYSSVDDIITKPNEIILKLEEFQQNNKETINHPIYGDSGRFSESEYLDNVLERVDEIMKSQIKD